MTATFRELDSRLLTLSAFLTSAFSSHSLSLFVLKLKIAEKIRDHPNLRNACLSTF